MVFERQLHAAAPRDPQGPCQRLGEKFDRPAATIGPAVAGDEPDELTAELRSGVDPALELVGRIRRAPEGEPFRMAPGDHELQGAECLAKLLRCRAGGKLEEA